MEQIREDELRNPVRIFFEEKKYSVFDERKLFTRKIDVVAKRRQEIITVELKLRAWRRAIQQACLNLRVSDYAYIALPEDLLSKMDRRLYYDAYINGIGILSVNGIVKQIIPPEKSKKIQSNLRRSFLKYLREEEDKI